MLTCLSGVVYPYIVPTDSLPDSNYLTTVLKMECWKRQSLMYSEEERRRTFRSHWPLHGVNWEACANAGFYYIGKCKHPNACRVIPLSMLNGRP